MLTPPNKPSLSDETYEPLYNFECPEKAFSCGLKPLPARIHSSMEYNLKPLSDREIHFNTMLLERHEPDSQNRKIQEGVFHRLSGQVIATDKFPSLPATLLLSNDLMMGGETFPNIKLYYYGESILVSKLTEEVIVDENGLTIDFRMGVDSTYHRLTSCESKGDIVKELLIYHIAGLNEFHILLSDNNLNGLFNSLVKHSLSGQELEPSELTSYILARDVHSGISLTLSDLTLSPKYSEAFKDYVLSNGFSDKISFNYTPEECQMYLLNLAHQHFCPDPYDWLTLENLDPKIKIKATLVGVEEARIWWQSNYENAVTDQKAVNKMHTAIAREICNLVRLVMIQKCLKFYELSHLSVDKNYLGKNTLAID